MSNTIPYATVVSLLRMAIIVVADAEVITKQLPAVMSLPGPKIPPAAKLILSVESMNYYLAVKVVEAILRKKAPNIKFTPDIKQTFKTREEFYIALVKIKNDLTYIYSILQAYKLTSVDAQTFNKDFTLWLSKNVVQYVK